MSEPIVLSEWRQKLENSTASKSPSQPNTTSVEHGQTSINDDELHALMTIYLVVAKSRQEPFTTKSEFARYAANEIALCASEGFITTKVNEQTYGNVWMVTQLGLEYLKDLDDVLGD